MTLPQGSFSGMNRRNALILARSLGCRINPVIATGEIRVSHPCMPQSLTINGRRKDCERKLTCFLRALVRKLEPLGGRPPSSQTLAHIAEDFG